MRVLHTIESSALGGAEKLTLSIAEGLARRGYEPFFAVPEGSWLAEQLKRSNLNFRGLPARRPFDLSFLKWLTKLIKEEKIALVHSHMMAMNLYGAAAARWAHIPCVPTLHGRLYDLEKSRRRLIYRFIARSAKRIVAVSEELREALINEAGIPAGRVVMIPNGVEIPPPRPPQGVVEPLVISVGSLTEVKGHRYLIEAFAEIYRQFPKSRLMIIGEGPCRPELEALIAKLDLGEAVSLPGRLEDAQNWLRSARVFAFPSLSEGQSLSLLEAMALGLPVVATRVGGNTEIVKDGATGFLVEPASPKKLAQAITRLLSDEQLASQLGTAGRGRVKKKFSLEAMLDRYEVLYKMALAHGSRQKMRAEKSS